MKAFFLIALALLSGCATPKPAPCAAFEAHSVVVEGRFFAILTEDNARKLAAMLTGMDAGTCSLPK